MLASWPASLVVGPLSLSCSSSIQDLSSASRKHTHRLASIRTLGGPASLGRGPVHAEVRPGGCFYLTRGLEGQAL